MRKSYPARAHRRCCCKLCLAQKLRAALVALEALHKAKHEGEHGPWDAPTRARVGKMIDVTRDALDTIRQELGL